MTFDQSFLLALLAAVLALFMWGRLRHDVVAILALLAATIAGQVSMSDAFSGFANPATVTVALVLIVSRGLVNSGAVNLIARRLIPPMESPTAHVGILSSVGGAMSSFMNNVGALALLMPAALQSAQKANRSPSVLLMPLAFGSILGGLVTLIGTPPNIIIASMREQMMGQPFGMFDFTPVGGAVAIAGIIFIALVGWRLIPRDVAQRTTVRELFDIENYVTEARIPDEHEFIGKELRDLDEIVTTQDAVILGVLRGEHRVDPAMRRTHIRAGDVLLIEAGPEAINATLSSLKLRPPAPKPEGEDTADESIAEKEKNRRPSVLGGPDVAIAEAVVQPGSRIAGRTTTELNLRTHFGVNLLAVARQGRPFRGRLRAFRFRTGDVLLLEGESDRLNQIIGTLGCLPLAERSIQGSRNHMAWLSIGLFGAAIAATTMGLLSFPVALATAVVAMVMLNIVPARELYDGIDWSVIVLLGAMIPVGQAMQDTGTTTVIAAFLSSAVTGFPAVVALGVVLTLTIALTNVINNAAAAVVMAPIAVDVANQINVSSDSFLMAVAIAASCAFLTPIGHQNNALVMGPGGYKFRDFWRMGLPLEILVIAVSIPMLLWVWPLN